MVLQLLFTPYCDPGQGTSLFPPACILEIAGAISKGGHMVTLLKVLPLMSKEGPCPSGALELGEAGRWGWGAHSCLPRSTDF